jgi:hypothetical protein
MLDKAEIRKEIARLEYEESSYHNYAMLADLYVIRKQMQEDEKGSRSTRLHAYSGEPDPAVQAAASQAEVPQTVGSYGDSDFLRAIEGKKPSTVWPIMDELMDTLAVVNARVYNSVMQKIKRGESR